MAQLTVPLDEAIRVFTASVQLPAIFRRVEPTPQGPRVVLRLSPITREFGVTIRFARFEGGAAHFVLDGLPGFLNLGALFEPPEGIEFDGDRLTVRPAALLESVGVKGVRVSSVQFAGGAYVIQISA